MYCSIENILDQISNTSIAECLGEPNDTGNEWQERVTKYIQSASDEIDGYISNRYKTPLQIVPNIIKEKCVEISIFKILCRKGIKKDSDESIWVTRYNNAIAFLKDVNAGKIELGEITPNGGSDISSDIGMSFVSPKANITDNFWKGFL
ncbi:MAG TPA: DUF1320 domain-containing protein [Spirochaetota bacterium]|nr:DUF1320 domain-containing protein [Spirochaetota bacterium]